MRSRLTTMAVLVVLMAACGSGAGDLATQSPTTGSDDQATTDPTNVPTATLTPDQPTPTEVPAPTPTPTPTPPSLPEAVVISYSSVSYDFATAFEYTQAVDGSYRVETSETDIWVFDASTGLSRSYFVFDDGESSVFTDAGFGTGPPDRFGAGFFVQAGAALHALAGEGLGLAGTGERLGRPTIVYSSTLVPNAIGGGPDFSRVEVDAETGIVLHYEASEGGTTVIALEALEVTPLAERPEVFDLGPNIEVGPPDYSGGFSPVDSLAEAESLVGYAVPLPEVVPPGYELAEVRVSPGRTDVYTGPEASNPPNVDVVSILYRNGWRSFTISTRRVGDVDATFGWLDPFGGEGQFYESTTFVVRTGVLAGATAEITTAPETIPHGWVLGDELVFTVSGPLTEAELVAVVESLS